VTYDVTGSGWLLAETHLHLATSLNGIPKSQGSPAPSLFAYGQTHPLVSSYTYTIATPPGWSPGTLLYVAAQAVVAGPSGGTAVTIASDESVTVIRRRTGDGTANANFTSLNQPAVRAWEPGASPASACPAKSNERNNSYWDTNLYPADAANRLVEAGADWIWDTCWASGSNADSGTTSNANTIFGSVVTFSKSIEVAGTPASAVLDVTCDNTFEAFLNGSRLSMPPTGSSGFQTSNLGSSWVTSSGWQSIQTYTTAALALIHEGSNELRIDAGNEQKSIQDDGSNGTNSTNPGGCIFALTVGSAGSGGATLETAWGYGPSFSGKNWATYFTYTVQ
jgi:hypothetical protein